MGIGAWIKTGRHNGCKSGCHAGILEADTSQRFGKAVMRGPVRVQNPAVADLPIGGAKSAVPEHADPFDTAPVTATI
ncbi:hypothetical protein TPL01_25490 [Sulfuriferula plumbiphila]|uniref:Uncharacterized protein n=1 Tax=Sulfuriferula plumbiphila TaxID=171865 RepID=A0A512LB94_9PROT|nr:hypothetical protein SFPGR_05330 [Sulfuriferula plumbiphila]GEP31411.1 hypothetical protein TPL01_25490 [Sulfuriferula plumbiphila]